MAVSVQQIHPVAHLPLVLGVLRRLEVATVIDHLLPPHPAHVLSTGRGVEALVLAILDGGPCTFNLRVNPAAQNPVQCLLHHLCEGALSWYPTSFSTRSC
jgi:hypothetical protein